MTEYEYITIQPHGFSPSGKTRLWWVRNKKSGDRLGIVKWLSAWRQYTFWAISDTIWSAGCMRDIADFIKEEMAAHKRARKGIKVAT